MAQKKTTIDGGSNLFDLMLGLFTGKKISFWIKRNEAHTDLVEVKIETVRTVDQKDFYLKGSFMEHDPLYGDRFDANIKYDAYNRPTGTLVFLDVAE